MLYAGERSPGAAPAASSAETSESQVEKISRNFTKWPEGLERSVSGLLCAGPALPGHPLLCFKTSTILGSRRYSLLDSAPCSAVSCPCAPQSGVSHPPALEKPSGVSWAPRSRQGRRRVPQVKSELGLGLLGGTGSDGVHGPARCCPCRGRVGGQPARTMPSLLQSTP